MKWNGNLADLALGIAGDEKDVVALPQNQSPSSRGEDSDAIPDCNYDRPAVLSPGYWVRSLEPQNRWEVAKPPQGLWPELLQNLGINGPQNLPEPLLACQGRVCLGS